jgi:hypothetical protein
MAEMHGRLGPLLACHVIQRVGPQLNPGMLTPAPARLRPPGGRSRPIADPFPADPAGIHYLDTMTGSARSRDLRRE